MKRFLIFLIALALACLAWKCFVGLPFRMGD
jgi:hypothetical protein